MKGEADLERVHGSFAPQSRSANGWILKLVECYRSHNARALLFECVSVRSGFSQNYFVRAERKSGGLSIRVDPRTNIEKNEGVKRILVLVRDAIVAVSPGLVLETTNLPEELLTPGRERAAE